MKRIFYLLLFIPSVCFAQDFNYEFIAENEHIGYIFNAELDTINTDVRIIKRYNHLEVVSNVDLNTVFFDAKVLFLGISAKYTLWYSCYEIDSYTWIEIDPVRKHIKFFDNQGEFLASFGEKVTWIPMTPYWKKN